MKLKNIIVAMFSLCLLSACATNGVPEVNPEAVNYEMTYQEGVITQVKHVMIKDNGNGTFLGAAIGAVLGSMFGQGNGNGLSMLGGGLGGAYVGNQIGKENAQELYVQLKDNRHIVVIAKGKRFIVGEKIRVVNRDGVVFRVEHAQDIKKQQRVGEDY